MTNLTKVHTKKLLKYLEQARACGGSYTPNDWQTVYTVEELKKELATREHVPNKDECRKLRQQCAKEKRHR